MSGINEINDILLLDRSSLLQKIKLTSEIRNRKYDLVFDFFSNPTTALITFFSGAKYRVGFPYRGRKYAYNLFGPEERQKYHSADLHLKTLENLDIGIDTKELLFSLSEDEILFRDKFFNEKNLSGKTIIGICPSGGWESKKCPPEKFAEFAEAVYNKYNIILLILWGPGDYDDAIEIQKTLSVESVIAPPTSIKQMAALMTGCAVLIANDSGPMHISAALKVPTIALFGPTDPFLQGSYGTIHETMRLDDLECINCNLTLCPKKKECFNNMTSELLLNKFKSITGKNKLKVAERNG